MYFLFYLRNLSANVAYNFLDPMLSKRHASVILLTTDWQTVKKYSVSVLQQFWMYQTVLFLQVLPALI